MNMKICKISRLILLFQLIFVFNSLDSTAALPGEYSEKPDSLKTNESCLPVVKIYPNGTRNFTLSHFKVLNTCLDDPFLSGISQASSNSYFTPGGYKVSDYGFTYNGIKLNSDEEIENYFPAWSALLNQINLSGKGLSFSNNVSAFGGVAGTYQSDESMFENANTFVSWTSANSMYRNGFQVNHSTGLMNNGWMFSFGGSGALAQKSYVEGTAFNEWTYFLFAKKQFNTKQSLSLTVTGAPVTYLQNDAAQLEAYELRNTNYYNPDWGYYGDARINAKEFRSHIPVAVLGHDWKISEKAELKTSASYSQGTKSITELEWNNAVNPYPTYYRNMPSYHESEFWDSLFTAEWTNNVDFYQINWDNIYRYNNMSLYTVEDAEGVAGNTVAGNLANYYLSQHNQDIRDVHFTTVLSTQTGDRLKFRSGIYIQRYQKHAYKTMKSLLGSDFHLDILSTGYYFSDDEPYNDKNHPNNLIYEDDVFGYDYIANIDTYQFFSSAGYEGQNLKLLLSGSIALRNIQREGLMKNWAFPDNSFGKSEVKDFINYNINLGTSYSINKSHIVQFNSYLISQSPDFADIFLVPEISDADIDYCNKFVYGGRLSYSINTKSFSSRVSLFYSDINNQTTIKHYIDESNNIGFIVAADSLDQINEGVELGIDYKINRFFTFKFAASQGLYFYNSRPGLDIYYEYFPDKIIENETAYIINYFVPGIPQTFLTAGVDFQTANNWLFSVRGNYYGNCYSDFSFEIRTELSTHDVIMPDPVWEEILSQEKLTGGFTMDCAVGKTWKVFSQKHDIQLLLRASNVLNNQNIMLTGKEPYRFDLISHQITAAKYMLMYGRNFFITLSYKI